MSAGVWICGSKGSVCGFQAGMADPLQLQLQVVVSHPK